MKTTFSFQSFFGVEPLKLLLVTSLGKTFANTLAYNDSFFDVILVLADVLLSLQYVDKHILSY